MAASEVPSPFTSSSLQVGILASRMELFEALLGLADSPIKFCKVQQAASDLLGTLPTLPLVPKSIAEALDFEQPSEAIKQLLAKSGPITSMRLVYFVEV